MSRLGGHETDAEADPPVLNAECDHPPSSEDRRIVAGNQRRLSCERFDKAREPLFFGAADEQNAAISRAGRVGLLPDGDFSPRSRLLARDFLQSVGNRSVAGNADRESIGRCDRSARPLDVLRELIQVRGLHVAFRCLRRRLRQENDSRSNDSQNDEYALRQHGYRENGRATDAAGASNDRGRVIAVRYRLIIDLTVGRTPIRVTRGNAPITLGDGPVYYGTRMRIFVPR